MATPKPAKPNSKTYAVTLTAKQWRGVLLALVLLAVALVLWEVTAFKSSGAFYLPGMYKLPYGSQNSVHRSNCVELHRRIDNGSASSSEVNRFNDYCGDIYGGLPLN